MTAELRRLNELILNAAHDSSQYELKPHLSLLYKKMAADTLRDLVASIYGQLRLTVPAQTFGSAFHILLDCRQPQLPVRFTIVSSFECSHTNETGMNRCAGPWAFLERQTGGVNSK